jgi:hypothetical protein
MKPAKLLICSLLAMPLATVAIFTARAQAPVPVRVEPPPVITQPQPPVITQPLPPIPAVTLPVPEFGPEDVPGPVLPGVSQSAPTQNVQGRPGQATFILHDDDRYILGVEFFSQTRPDWTWPGNGQEYDLSGSKTYSLACNNGEKICVGAWRDRQTVSWGVGHGKNGCRGCCTFCGNPPLELTFNDGGPDSFPTQVSGGQEINQVIGVITAILNGVAGADAVGPGCQASLGC